MKSQIFCFFLTICLSLCKGIEINKTCEAYDSSFSDFQSEKNESLTSLIQLQNTTLYEIAKYGEGNNCTTAKFLRHDNQVDVVYNITTGNVTVAYNFTKKNVTIGNETNPTYETKYEIEISNISYDFKLLYDNFSDYFVFWGCNTTNHSSSHQILIVFSENKTRTINSNDTVAKVFKDRDLTSLLHSDEICEKKEPEEPNSGAKIQCHIFLIVLTAFFIAFR